MTRQAIRKQALINSGTLSPNPWDLTLSRQNGCSKLKALERRTELRRDATRAPIQGPEWQGTASMPTPSHTQNQTRRTLANCRRKMVLTRGSTSLGGFRVRSMASLDEAFRDCRISHGPILFALVSEDEKYLEKSGNDGRHRDQDPSNRFQRTGWGRVRSFSRPCYLCNGRFQKPPNS